MKLSLMEQITRLETNEALDQFTVTTASQRIANLMIKRGFQEVPVNSQLPVPYRIFVVPRKALCFRSMKSLENAKTRVISPELAEARRARILQMHADGRMKKNSLENV